MDRERQQGDDRDHDQDLGATWQPSTCPAKHQDSRDGVNIGALQPDSSRERDRPLTDNGPTEWFCPRLMKTNDEHPQADHDEKRGWIHCPLPAATPGGSDADAPSRWDGRRKRRHKFRGSGMARSIDDSSSFLVEITIVRT